MNATNYNIEVLVASCESHISAIAKQCEVCMSFLETTSSSSCAVQMATVIPRLGMRVRILMASTKPT